MMELSLIDIYVCIYIYTHILLGWFCYSLLLWVLFAMYICLLYLLVWFIIWSYTSWEFLLYEKHQVVPNKLWYVFGCLWCWFVLFGLRSDTIGRMFPAASGSKWLSTLVGVKKCSSTIFVFLIFFKMFHRYMKEDGRVGQHTSVRLTHSHYAHVPLLKRMVIHLHWVPLWKQFR